MKITLKCKKYGNMFNQNYISGNRHNYSSTPNLNHLPDINSPHSSFFQKREISIPDLSRTPQNQFGKSASNPLIQPGRFKHLRKADVDQINQMHIEALNKSKSRKHE